VPEKKRRRVVKGLREAARVFEEYVATRVLAETDSGQLAKELRKFRAEVKRGLREKNG
jgi:hypothetical protein